jgi:hypothetical protein
VDGCGGMRRWSHPEGKLDQKGSAKRKRWQGAKAHDVGAAGKHVACSFFSGLPELAIPLLMKHDENRMLAEYYWTRDDALLRFER